MFFYWGKRVESEQVGTRLIRVECTNCGCEYFYRLTRIGIGTGTAPYGVGVAHANRSAQGQSQRDLNRRLAFEAELVPCPKCNWINDDLIQGYRRGKYRRLGNFAFVVGTVGTIGSLICAWFISIGPAADRAVLPYFLFGGPMLFILLPVVIVVLRFWMRSRIHPNRDFPLAPQLPAASPPALFMEQSSGELKLAKTEIAQVSVFNDGLDFQIGRHQLPLLCCDCLQSANNDHAYKCQLTGTIELEIPRCKDCTRYAKRESRRIWLITAALLLLVAGAVVVPMRLKSFEFWVIIGSSLLISVALASYIASKSTAPVKVVARDRSRGVIRLRFRNAEYGRFVAKRISDSGETN